MRRVAFLLLLLLSACRAQPAPSVVLAGHGEVMDLRVDGSAMVYLDADASALRRMEMSGGAAITFATSAPGQLSFALDGTSVYWIDATAGLLQRAPKGGGAPTTLAKGQMGGDSLAVDETTVFWTVERGIRSIPKTGGSLAIVTTARTVGSRAIVLDGSSIYFHGDDGLSEVPKAGGDVTKLAKLNDVMALAVGDDVYALCLTGPTTERVVKVPKKGGAPVELGATKGTATRLLLARGSLWFAGYGAGDGEILYREPIGGGSPVAATPPDERISGIRGIASDGSNIVFAAAGHTNSQGGVFRVPGG
jgi:hypothetical protein